MVRSKHVALGILVMTPALFLSAEGKGPNLSKWTTHEIRFMGSPHFSKLAFKVPGNPSSEFGPFHIIPEVALYEPKSYSNTSGIFQIYWDYRGFFWQGVFGTLVAEIQIFDKKSSDREFDLLNPNEVVSYLKTRYSRRSPNPDSSHETSPPRTYERITLGENTWFKGRWSGATDMEEYVIGISSGHCLVVRARFIDNSSRYPEKRKEWRPKAQAVADQIVQTLRLMPLEGNR